MVVGLGSMWPGLALPTVGSARHATPRHAAAAAQEAGTYLERSFGSSNIKQTRRQDRIGSIMACSPPTPPRPDADLLWRPTLRPAARSTLP